jgi:uncharacterized protein (DUF305 family)
MILSIRSTVSRVVVVVALATTSACGAASRTNAEMEALAARNRQPHTPADTRFMTMMIPHHAQAVLFGGWAESHDAGRAVGVLAARMVVAQKDEIDTMRTWLRDRGEPVPPAEYSRGAGGDHATMPGMLTEAQLDELDAARGAEFDRLFLTYMIPHHEGAIQMVDELFASNGGAQDDFVFKLASDLAADQEIEIERMRVMLEEYPQGAPR